MKNYLPDEWLFAGSLEYYQDADLYDYDYRKRRTDIKYYTNTIKKLRTKQSHSILELGCGTGRILLPLLKEGHQMIGIDHASPMLKRLAQKLKRLSYEKQKNVYLLQANFLKIPINHRKNGFFEFILCPFNTFMHLYTRIQVEIFLQQIYSLLTPTGYLIFDLLNPDLEWLCRDPNKRWSKTKFRHPITNEHLFYTTNHMYEQETQILFIHFYYQSAISQKKDYFKNSEQVIRLAHRQFFPAELEALLFYNGFNIEKRYGDFLESPFCSSSNQQIIIATKRKEGSF